MEKSNKKNKLLKKVSQKYLLFGLFLIFVSLVILYFLTRGFIKEETDEGLYSSTYRIEQLLKNNEDVASIYPIFEIEEVTVLKAQSLKDTLIYDELEREKELFRELVTFKEIGRRKYQITVRTLLLESEDILLSILLSYTVIILLMYLAQYYYSQATNRVIWKPFFDNLEVIKKFSVRSNSGIDLSDSDVLEFSELNDNLKSLTTKVTTDYKNLKQFTEDISHEIQTPLAIIQAKIENLMNDTENFKEGNVIALNEIQKNVNRLSRLNRGLILLAKIDNQQFNELENVDINSITKTVTANLEDIANIKKVNIGLSEKDTIKLLIDKTLADVLLSNLIGNAVKYTPENGNVDIVFDEKIVAISNSGERPLSDPDKMFQRFYKEDKISQSLGLGLAIVKKICDYYGFAIHYTFNKGKHCYTLNFSS